MRLQGRVRFIIFIIGILLFSYTIAHAENRITEDNLNTYDGFKGGIGIGLGIPYGVLGTNLEVGTDYFTGSLGLGLIPPVFALGWSAGGRLYLDKLFLGTRKEFRPRIGCFYGITGMYAIAKKDMFSATSDYDYELYEGIAPSAGFVWDFSENAFVDFDLVMLFNQEKIKDDYDKKKEELGSEGYSPSSGGIENFSPIKISVGFGLKW